MKRVVAIVFALVFAGCVREVVLRPAPDAGDPDGGTPDSFDPDADAGGDADPDGDVPPDAAPFDGVLPDAALDG